MPINMSVEYPKLQNEVIRLKKEKQELLNALQDAREVMLYYMDAPEWNDEQDNVYEKAKTLISKYETER